MTRYLLMPERSTVRITARSSLHPIQSESPGLEGYVETETVDGSLDLSNSPTGHLEMAVARLSSGNALYDREMRRRVDARRHPLIEGELDSIEAGPGDGRYLVSGRVSFHGVSRSYTDEMRLSWPSEATMCLEGEHEFDLRDFSLEPPKVMMLRVYPEVVVGVRVLAKAQS